MTSKHEKLAERLASILIELNTYGMVDIKALVDRFNALILESVLYKKTLMNVLLSLIGKSRDHATTLLTEINSVFSIKMISTVLLVLLAYKIYFRNWIVNFFKIV